MKFDLTFQDLASIVRGYTVRAEFCEDYGTRETNVNDAFWLNMANEHRVAAERWQAIYETELAADEARTDASLAECAA
jgi:hypothetical protein